MQGRMEPPVQQSNGQYRIHLQLFNDDVDLEQEDTDNPFVPNGNTEIITPTLDEYIVQKLAEAEVQRWSDTEQQRLNRPKASVVRV